MPEVVQKRLPDWVVQEAVTHAEAGDLLTALAVVFDQFGYDLLNNTETIKVTSMAIPKDQWETIARGLVKGNDTANEGVHPMARVNLMMDWINYGPSGYEEEAQ
jgi:hypothetical protein